MSAYIQVVFWFEAFHREAVSDDLTGIAPSTSFKNNKKKG